jgi:hypothetical protein
MTSDRRSDVNDLIAYMRTHIEEPRSEMAQKGYFWDSVFWQSTEEGDFLYIVLKSENFAAIMRDDIGLLATPFRKVYDRFRKLCWSPDGYVEMEPVFCFNSSMTFSG